MNPNKMIKSIKDSIDNYRIEYKKEMILKVDKFFKTEFKSRNDLDKIFYNLMGQELNDLKNRNFRDLTDDECNLKIDMYFDNILTEYGIPKDNWGDPDIDIDDWFCRDWLYLRYADYTFDAIYEISDFILKKDW